MPETSYGHQHPILTSISQLAFLKPYVKTRFNVSVFGLEQLKALPTTTGLFVANHSSDIDPAVIFATLPASIARNLATGAAADRFFTETPHTLLPKILFNLYPVDRPGKSATRSHAGLSNELLRAGHSLLIFPEGTRRGTPGILGRFSFGPARLSQRHSIPVIPISIFGASIAWPVDAPRPIRGRPHIFIKYGKPLTPYRSEPAILMTHRIRESIAQGYNELSALAERPSKMTPTEEH